MKTIFALLAAVLLASAGTSRAATLLGLAIDRSGSISNADYALQINAYINVLNNISVIPRDGSLAIGVYSFGGSANTIFPAAFITGANHAALMTAVTGMLTRADTGATALGPAIALAANDLWSLSSDLSDRHVIDVSTDGFGNTGINQVTASNNALALGIDQINGLGVGSGANLNFVGGAGSFAVQVSSFNDFETAIERKIIRETRGVPEGGFTVFMLGGAMLGMAVLRRRLA